MSTRDGKWFFTSEAVTMGHPDKMADQVSDAILDAIINDDHNARVACETLVKTGMVLVSGEITKSTYIEVHEVVRQTVKEIGYDSSEIGFDYHTCAVLTAISQQSADIDEAVTADTGKGKELGAGDQGIMFGYASNETELYMPLPIDLARKIVWRAAEVRLNGDVNWLRPDGKAQVTIEYEGSRPVRIHTVVASMQHSPTVSHKQIEKDLIEKVIKPVLPPGLIDKNIIYHINPSGRFVIGGPQGDCGVTGRKIISTRTAAWATTAAARSAARTPPRSTAAPATPRATRRRTSWPPAWPTAARSSSRTRSAWRSRCRCSSRPSAPARYLPRS